MASLSGNKALAEIDKVLQSARGNLANVDAEFGTARSALARLRASELSLYAELARLRLIAIEQGVVADSLDEADRDAARILEEREAAAARLDGDIKAAESALAGDERHRSDQQGIVAAASQALDAAEAAAQDSLEADPAYREQLARVDQADFIADQAEDKASAAETDRIEKGEPYESDSLFAYLWSRGYGTSKYHAFPLVRWLDARVAKLCNYEPARQNYSLLIDIPLRLTEHAAVMRGSFDQEAEALATLEETAAAAAGVPECQAALTAAEQQLAAIDAEIAAREDNIRALVVERRTFAAGEDEFYRQCLDVLSQAMQRRSTGFLRERAARTLDRTDDDVVRRLEELDDEADRIERDLREFERLHDSESRRLTELEDLRRRFKSEGFDDTLSEFKDWALIALVLREFLRGASGSNDVWKTIRRQQRTKRVKANPNFGTLRFPRAPKAGPWRMPKGGGFKGGGFRTGGGFKGGGFKTGGGFKGGGGFKTGGGF
jgi:hypothetical protein